MSQAPSNSRRPAHVKGPTLQVDPAGTLPALLLRAAHEHPENGIVFVDGDGGEEFVAYPEILAGARRRLGALQARGLGPGDRLIVMPRSTRAFVELLWGCFLGGIVPAPVPTIQGAAAAELSRLVGVWQMLGQPALVVPDERSVLEEARDALAAHTLLGPLPKGEAIAAHVPRVWSAAELDADPAVADEHQPSADELALLLYSSGSTSAPKGVMVSHAGALADLAATCQHNGFGPADTTLGWAPLYHVIGLTCFHLLPVTTGATQVLVDPLAMIKRPEIWLEKIHAHRVAYTGGPNFAFAMCCDRIDDTQLAAWDLSCLRVLLNGGEVVSVATLRRFLRKFQACGLRSEALAPAFGMSETAGGICYPRPTEKFRAFRLDRRGGDDATGGGTAEYANLGYVLPGFELRIVDAQERVLPEREIGQIEVRGPAVTRGYWGDEAATQTAIVDGWLRTGDLGFVSREQLAVVGRLKDVIIVHGHNYYAHDLEQAAREVPGVRSDRVVATSCFDPALDRERVIVFVALEADADPATADAVAAAVQGAVGVRVDRVIVLAADDFPRTAAGKLHRYELRARLERGMYDSASPADKPKPPDTEPRVNCIAGHVESRLTEILLAHIAAALSVPVERLDPRASFVELGLDSLLAVQMARELEDLLGVRLPATALFEFPNASALAELLAARLGDDAETRIAMARAAPGNQAPAPTAPRNDACRVEGVRSHGTPQAATLREERRDHVAIIGMAGRFPGAADLDAFWRLLAEGREAIGEIPPQRWPLEGFYDPRPGVRGRSTSKWAGMLEGVELFDARYFGISPHEAQRMDPQQRLLIETAWEALERAGRAGSDLAGSSTGVFVGISVHDYLRGVLADPDQVDAYTATGNFLSIAANRLSYLFDLKGPSLAVDTGCSSSLVAVHLAVESLLRGECRQAIVGTAHLHFTPELYVNFSQAGMLAPDGHVKTFDRRANGYVRGEGVAAVVLKPLSAALADGDPIQAVIRGTAVNQDGRTNGLTAPNAAAQVEVLQAAWQRAGIRPTQLSLVEAHGTGTALGDPIEFEALSRAFAADDLSHEQATALGSVKTNIGHLEPASGLAGLLKVVLAMRHGQIPPTLNFETPGDLMRFDESPFYVVDRPRAWPRGEGPRLAGVSSFGFGGTNVHVVVEEAPAVEAVPHDESRHVLPLSARTPQGLLELARRFAEHLEAHPRLEAAEVCLTAGAGRAALAYRLAVVGRKTQELAERLHAFLAEGAAQLSAMPPGAVHSDPDHGWALGRVSPLGGQGATVDDARDSWRAAESFVRGEPVDFATLAPRGARRVELPPSPLSRERFWLGSQLPPPTATDERVAESPPPRFAAQVSSLEETVRDVVATALELPAADVDPQRPLVDQGLDSILAARIARHLGETLDRRLPQTLCFEHATVERLAAALAGEYGVDASTAPTTGPTGRESLRSTGPQLATAGPSFAMAADDSAIAVIGFGGRFPQSADLAEFWRHLAAGDDLVTEVPEHRWSQAAYFSSERGQPGKSYSKWAALLDDIDQFDAEFFHIAPREAAAMDPQQRLLLEVAWETLEAAGYAGGQLRGTRTGVFIGAMASEYLPRLLAQSDRLPTHVATGNATSVIANRTSYYLDLKGPCLAVDTACSSALVAVHLAVQSLRRGECEYALAGATQVGLAASHFQVMSRLGALSPTGRCHAFDSAADGYVLGEGVGLVLLKPLARALADGDRICGVIRGTAMNHGGEAAGLTVPTPQAQAEVIRAALADAHLSAAEISYVEAHGTGTRLGDPIEIDGLRRAFAADTRRRQFCALGSVKANIGHLEPAAGIAGLIKVLLSLEAQALPPSRHLAAVNPALALDESPFFINDVPLPWPRGEKPRRAGVSAFGFGGTNAHVVVEEAPVLPPPDAPQSGLDVLLVSARDEQALAELCGRYAEFLGRQTTFALADVCATAAVGRRAMTCRRAFVARSRDALIEQLRQAAAGRWTTLPTSERALRWLAGEEIDWSAEAGSYRKVPLPTYPFQRQRYWIDEEPAEHPIGAAPSEIEPWLHEIAWQSAPASDARRSIAGQWLLISKRSPQVASLASRLRDAGAEVVERFIGQADGDNPNLCRIEPAKLAGVIYCMSPVDDAANLVTSAIGEAAGILRGIARGPLPPELWIATHGAWAIGEGGRAHVAAAAVAAMARTARIERLARRVYLVDLEKSAGLEQLFSEIVRDQPLAEVAIRGGRRFVPCARQTAPIAPTEAKLPEGSVCLITGGLGGIGGALARSLARETSCRVILCGRSREDDPRVKSALVELRRAGLGAQVAYASCDVADKTQVAALVDRIMSEHGRIDFVIHAAGVLGDCLLHNATREALGDVLRAKLAGTANVEAATRRCGRRAFVMLSSLAVTAGNSGQALYAAANAAAEAYLDVLRRAGDATIRTLAFGPWAEVGMAVDDATRAKLEAAGLRFIGPAVGTRIICAALGGEHHGMLVFRTRGQDEADASGQPQPLWRINPTSGVEETLPPAATDVAPVDDLLTLVREELARALAIDVAAIDDGRPFQELGLDSLMAEDLVRMLRTRLNLPNLTVAAVFQCPTAVRLAAHLASLGARPNLPAATPAVAIVPSPDEDTTSAARIHEATASRDIAVIGYACQFPGATNADEFWKLLDEGRDVIGPMPEERYAIACAYDPSVRARYGAARPRGGFFRRIDQFDPEFFRMSPAEAEQLDPRQRLLLETSWRAVEHAGYASRISGTRTGVFVGCGANDYLTGVPLDELTMHAATGNTSATLPGRLAYFFDLHGPCLPVDTACSSGLVAVHLAVESLRRGEAEMALVGAVHLHLRLGPFCALEQTGALAAGGQCRAFAEAADGFVPGEGAAALLLKPLAQALADGDPIHAVIRGTAVNNDGRTNGLTAPNPRAQSELLLDAWKNAGIHAAQLDYIEAHGTGTPLGDPLEAEALEAAFAQQTRRRQFCRVGSVKSNLGHTDAVGGLAGMIKVFESLAHERLPRTLHVDAPNSRIAFERGPLVLAAEAWDWPRGDMPRRAGVSAFGFSGTNAHVVVEEPPTRRAEPPAVTPASFQRRHCWLPSRWPEIPQPPAYELTWIERPVAERDAVDLPLLLIAEEDTSARLAAAVRDRLGERRAIRCVSLDEACDSLTSQQAYSLVYLAGPNGQAALAALLRLAKIVAALPPCARGELRLVTRAAQAVTSGDLPDPALAANWGFLRAARGELHPLRCQAIDVADEDRSSELLANELSFAAGDAEVAFRGSRRLVSRVHATTIAESGLPALRVGGVYLITGGLGGIGLELARWLWRDFRARLVLVGRQARKPEAPEFGDRALIVAADVRDEVAMRQVVENTRALFGRIDGVFHAAGVNDRRRLVETTMADMDAILRPKLLGAEVLERVLADGPPDWTVYFSSVAGIDGNILQAAYSAANRGLDALAALRTAQGRRTLSVAWGLWSDVGMGAALVRERGVAGLVPEQALRWLARAIEDGRSNLIIDAGRDTTSSITGEEPGAQQDVGSQERPNDVFALEAVLRQSLAEVLAAEPERLDRERAFLDLGLDSMLALRWMRALEKLSGTQFRATLPFDYPSLDRLAEHLVATLPEDARKRLAAPAKAAGSPPAFGETESCVTSEGGNNAGELVDFGLVVPENGFDSDGSDESNGREHGEGDAQQGRLSRGGLVLSSGRRVARITRRVR